MTNPDPSVLLSRLQSLRDQGLTWRQIHDEHYPGVSFQMLNKIARTGRLPKSAKLLRALGYVREKRLPKWLQPEAREWYEGQGRRVRSMKDETTKALREAKRGR